MLTPGRPTLRCLHEDLRTDWDNAAHQRGALRTPVDAPALDQLDHPVVRKAAELFPAGGDSDVERESISGLANPPWWKLKIGRWRAAVYEDRATGQAWVCAAGLRYKGEAKDFYKSFMERVTSLGPTAFLPSAADHERLRVEWVEKLLDTWEREVHQSSHTALVQAARDGEAVFFDLPMPRATETGQALARVSVEVVTYQEGDEGIAEVAVSVSNLLWEHFRIVQHAELIVLASIDPQEQDWQALHVDNVRSYSLSIDLADLEGLLALSGADRQPAATVAGTQAHYTHRERLMASTVTGTGVRALCGKFFVPRQDHQLLPACPECDALYRNLA